MAYSTPMNSSSTIPSSSSVPPPATLVPLAEKYDLWKLSQLFDLANKYNLGDAARFDTVDKARNLTRKVRIVITKHAADADGWITKRWNTISSQSKATMSKALHRNTPWLSFFEEDWMAEWLLSRQLNQKVSDVNRATHKTKEQETRAFLAKSCSYGKY